MISGNLAIVSCFIRGSHETDYAGMLAAIDVQKGEIVWSHTEPQTAFLAPSVVDNTIVVSASVEPTDGKSCARDPGRIFTFNILRGGRIGVLPDDEQPRSCSDVSYGSVAASVDDLAVFFTSEGPKAIDIHSLRVEWEYAATSGAAPSAASVVHDDILVVGAFSGIDYNLTAIDLRTGELEWQEELLPGDNIQTLALHGDRLFAGMSSGSIDIFDLNERSWVGVHQVGYARHLAVQDSRLWATISGRVAVFDVNTMERLYGMSCEGPANFTATVAYLRCKGRGGDGDAVQAWTKSDGAQLWSSIPMLGRSLSSLATTQGLVLATNAEGEMAALDSSGEWATRHVFGGPQDVVEGTVTEVGGLACMRMSLSYNGGQKLAVSPDGFQLIDKNGKQWNRTAPPYYQGGLHCTGGFGDTILFPGESIEGSIAFCHGQAAGPYQLRYEYGEVEFEVSLLRDDLIGIGCSTSP